MHRLRLQLPGGQPRRVAPQVLCHQLPAPGTPPLPWHRVAPPPPTSPVPPIGRSRQTAAAGGLGGLGSGAGAGVAEGLALATSVGLGGATLLAALRPPPAPPEEGGGEAVPGQSMGKRGKRLVAEPPPAPPEEGGGEAVPGEGTGAGERLAAVIRRALEGADEGGRDALVLSRLGAWADALEAAGGASFRVRQKRVVVSGGGEGGGSPPLRISALVRRYWFLCLLPPPAQAGGESTTVTRDGLSLRVLREEAVAKGLGPGDLPANAGRFAAERFASAAGVQDLFSHRVVRGRDLADAYRDRAVVNCMTGAAGPEFYARNPAAVGLLLVEGRDRRLVGRALVWRVDGGTMMDRVHPENGGDHVRYARGVARSKGWDVSEEEPARGHHACMGLQDSRALYSLCCALLGPGPSSEQGGRGNVPRRTVPLHVAPRYPIFDTFLYGSPADSNGEVVLSTSKEEGMSLIDRIWVQRAEAAFSQRAAAGLEPDW